MKNVVLIASMWAGFCLGPKKHVLQKYIENPAMITQNQDWLNRPSWNKVVVPAVIFK
jgi:hypothetical protein